MTYLRYLSLLAHSDAQHILCCVFVFVLYLVYPMLPISLDGQFLVSLRLSVTFIYGRHHALVDHYALSISQICFCITILISPSFY